MHISFVCMEVIACMEAERHYRGDLAIQCALLHDIIEDTNKNYTDVEKEFGEEVAKGVLALTKNPNLAKEYRMRDSLRRIRKEPVEVWLVKLADRITNLLPPPSHWGKEKIKRYREESIKIYNVLLDASKYLSKRLKAKISEYGNYL
jgi:(p)ppGpp synthase/HD superfamily hydrolase